MFTAYPLRIRPPCSVPCRPPLLPKQKASPLPPRLLPQSRVLYLQTHQPSWLRQLSTIVIGLSPPHRPNAPDHQRSICKKGRFSGFDPGIPHPIPEVICPNSCPPSFKSIDLICVFGQSVCSFRICRNLSTWDDIEPRTWRS
jgi:hypothetical protein